MDAKKKRAQKEKDSTMTDCQSFPVQKPLKHVEKPEPVQKDTAEEEAIAMDCRWSRTQNIVLACLLALLLFSSILLYTIFIFQEREIVGIEERIRWEEELIIQFEVKEMIRDFEKAREDFIKENQ